jgi:hypothetical protein
MSGRKPKASKTTVILRITEIWRVRLEGAAYLDIAEYIGEASQKAGSPWHLEPGEKPLSRRSIETYIQRVDMLIAESTKASRKRSLVKHLARREHLYAKAVNAGDIRTALAVLHDEAELRDLYPPQRKQLTGKDGAPLIPPPPVQVSEIIIRSREEANTVLAALTAASGLQRQ